MIISKNQWLQRQQQKQFLKINLSLKQFVFLYNGY